MEHVLKLILVFLVCGLALVHVKLVHHIVLTVLMILDVLNVQLDSTLLQFNLWVQQHILIVNKYVEMEKNSKTNVMMEIQLQVMVAMINVKLKKDGFVMEVQHIQDQFVLKLM